MDSTKVEITPADVLAFVQKYCSGEYALAGLIRQQYSRTGSCADSQRAMMAVWFILMQVSFDSLSNQTLSTKERAAAFVLFEELTLRVGAHSTKKFESAQKQRKRQSMIPDVFLTTVALGQILRSTVLNPWSVLITHITAVTTREMTVAIVKKVVNNKINARKYWDTFYKLVDTRDETGNDTTITLLLRIVKQYSVTSKNCRSTISRMQDQSIYFADFNDFTQDSSEPSDSPRTQKGAGLLTEELLNFMSSSDVEDDEDNVRDSWNAAVNQQKSVINTNAEVLQKLNKTIHQTSIPSKRANKADRLITSRLRERCQRSLWDLIHAIYNQLHMDLVTLKNNEALVGDEDAILDRFGRERTKAYESAFNPDTFQRLLDMVLPTVMAEYIEASSLQLSDFATDDRSSTGSRSVSLSPQALLNLLTSPSTLASESANEDFEIIYGYSMLDTVGDESDGLFLLGNRSPVSLSAAPAQFAPRPPGSFRKPPRVNDFTPSVLSVIQKRPPYSSVSRPSLPEATPLSIRSSVPLQYYTPQKPVSVSNPSSLSTPYIPQTQAYGVLSSTEPESVEDVVGDQEDELEFEGNYALLEDQQASLSGVPPAFGDQLSPGTSSTSIEFPSPFSSTSIEFPSPFSSTSVEHPTPSFGSLLEFPTPSAETALETSNPDTPGPISPAFAESHARTPAWRSYSKRQISGVYIILDEIAKDLLMPQSALCRRREFSEMHEYAQLDIATSAYFGARAPVKNEEQIALIFCSGLNSECTIERERAIAKKLKRWNEILLDKLSFVQVVAQSPVVQLFESRTTAAGNVSVTVKNLSNTQAYESYGQYLRSSYGAPLFLVPIAKELIATALFATVLELRVYMQWLQWLSLATTVEIPQDEIIRLESITARQLKKSNRILRNVYATVTKRNIMGDAKETSSIYDYLNNQYANFQEGKMSVFHEFEWFKKDE